MGEVVSIKKNKPRQPLILTHIHCQMCLDELPPGESAQDYASREIGFTPQGLQIWCRRHNANIVHMDFAGRTLRTIEGNE